MPAIAADDAAALWGALARPPATSIGDVVACLRAVLMKPEHLDWVDRIYAIIGEAADAVRGQREHPRALPRAPRNARTLSLAASLPAD